MVHIEHLLLMVALDLNGLIKLPQTLHIHKILYINILNIHKFLQLKYILVFMMQQEQKIQIQLWELLDYHIME